MTYTLTLDVPADLLQRVHGLPAETINRYAVAALRAAADSQSEPTSEADVLLVADALRAHQAGEDSGKPLHEVAARLSARYGFDNPLASAAGKA